MGGMDWIHVGQGREQGQALVNAVMNDVSSFTRYLRTVL
jgi:hypothetical protein